MTHADLRRVAQNGRGDTSASQRNNEHNDERRGGAAESLGDILKRLVPATRPAVRRQRSAVAAAWEQAAGPELTQETRPSTLQRGVLTIEVRSDALLLELQSFRRDELLARIVETDGKGRVTGLRFRPGVF